MYAHLLKNSMCSGDEPASWIEVNPYDRALSIVMSKKVVSCFSVQAGTGIRLIALSTNIPIETINERNSNNE